MSTIARAIALLRHIANEGAGGARLVDLSRRAGLPHPTTRRLLKKLIEERMVLQSSATSRYRLGPLTYEMGLAATNYYGDLVEICRPHLMLLVSITQDNAFLLMRSGHEALCLDRAEGQFSIRTVVLRIGGRRPLGVGPAGLALLAEMPDEQINDFLLHQSSALADFRATEPAKLWRAIEETRRKGYASCSEWANSGLDGVGVALPARGAAQAAISIVGPRERLDTQRIEHVAPLVLEAAEKIRADLSSTSWMG